MTYFKDGAIHWDFPKHVSLEHVSNYSQYFYSHAAQEEMIFDLRKTKEMHASFVGFLIHVKNTLSNNGANLKLMLSTESIRMLSMLNLMDYFSSDIYVQSKKSA